MAKRRRRDDDIDPLINAGLNAYQRLDRKWQIIVLIVVIVGAIIAAAVYFHAPAAKAAGQHADTSTANDPAATNNYVANDRPGRVGGSAPGQAVANSVPTSL